MNTDNGKRHVLQELHNERLLRDQWRQRALSNEATIIRMTQTLELALATLERLALSHTYGSFCSVDGTIEAVRAALEKE